MLPQCFLTVLAVPIGPSESISGWFPASGNKKVKINLQIKNSCVSLQSQNETGDSSLKEKYEVCFCSGQGGQAKRKGVTFR